MFSIRGRRPDQAVTYIDGVPVLPGLRTEAPNRWFGVVANTC
jgi:hypothetical protein